MAGHSKWKQIKRQKGVTDAKRGQVFTKIAREITVAARLGVPDPDANFRLRIAIQKARAEFAKLAAQKDSLRAESARRAAALSDSLRRAEETKRNQVRNAVAALLANPRALNSFMLGASHPGGLLGNRTKGDLQTQIDALQPFLTESGLTYQQFKDIVKASGITLFDKFGRMVPDSLPRVAGTGR